MSVSGGGGGGGEYTKRVNMYLFVKEQLAASLFLNQMKSEILRHTQDDGKWKQMSFDCGKEKWKTATHIKIC